MIVTTAGDTPAISHPRNEHATQDAPNHASRRSQGQIVCGQSTLSAIETGYQSMPTQSRDTWGDWFEDADDASELLTLQELLEEYPQLEVTPDTVRYWQKVDVLPQPHKRWHNGATRALYPSTYAFMAIREILDLQNQGYSLQQIKERLRRRVNAWRNRRFTMDRWEGSALEMATEYEQATGNMVDRVQIVFVDSDGEVDPYSYDVGSNRTE